MSKKIAIIIPTLNENENISKFLALIISILHDRNDYEVIFIDDNSTDGTLDTLYNLSMQFAFCRYIRRVHRKGLATACVEGMLSSQAQYFIVMDADMQHDHTLLPDIINLLSSGKANIVIGTRYAAGGSVGNWDKKRAYISQTATKLSNFFLSYTVSDPMSGFFGVTREVINTVCERLSGRGYKILFDIISTYGKGLNIIEIPYTFKERAAGKTKLNIVTCFDFVFMILDKLLGRYIYIDYLIYVFIGAIGACIHLLFLFIFHKLCNFDFIFSQIVSTISAMTFNYIGNNYITFSSNSFSGLKFVYGYIKYCVICSLGVFINISISEHLYSSGFLWWISGVLGALFGSFSNFLLSKFFVWK
jgi:dolichol-phosphate mannosyltransferase